jgi:hypothetical protein
MQTLGLRLCSTACRSAKLLHHNPVALDFVQIKLDRCGSFRRFRVRRLDLAEDFTLAAKAGRRASGASSGRRASRGCLSCWSGGTASGNPYVTLSITILENLAVGSGPGKKFEPRNGAAPDWEGLDELLGEVRTRQRHAVYLGRYALEIESFGLCL